MPKNVLTLFSIYDILRTVAEIVCNISHFFIFLYFWVSYRKVQLSGSSTRRVTVYFRLEQGKR